MVILITSIVRSDSAVIERGPLGLTETEVRAGFLPDFDNVATNVTVTPLPNNTGWMIRGESTLDNANEVDLVAQFERAIQVTASGRIIARHINLVVQPLFKNCGYAKLLLRESIRLYQTIGVEYVELKAIEDGTFVWPRLGWSIHGRSILEVHDEIKAMYREQYGSMIPDEFPLPVFGPEILLLTDAKGYRIGFEALKRFSLSHREIAMRLYLKQPRPLAILEHHGIL